MYRTVTNKLTTPSQDNDWDQDIESFAIADFYYAILEFQWVYRDVCDWFRRMWE